MQRLIRFFKKFRVYALSLILIFSFLTFIINIEICRAENGTTLYVGGNGSGNYSSIQDAIDNSSSEDTVFVYGGTYDGNLVINKSISLTGFDKNSTLIIGNMSLYTILIKSSWVNVSGFTIQNSKMGIYIPGPSYLNNHISENIISGNDEGIRLYNSSNNKITQNVINDHQNYGIIFYESSNNNISKNYLFNNIKAIFFGRWSNNNTIYNNNISENKFGVILDYSFYNFIIKNSITNSERGVSLLDSINNNVSNNIIEFNDDSGIYLSNSEENIISPNSFSENYEDIREAFQPPNIKATGFELIIIIFAVLLVFIFRKII